MKTVRWLLLILLAGCGGPPRYAPNEEFSADEKHHRDFQASPLALCDAARRALLGDGYLVNRADAQRLVGGKEFQVEAQRHAIVNIHVNCDQRRGGSTLYVTATEEHFDVKSLRQSSSIGFPVVAPIYYGTQSEADAQVKTHGETVSEREFYERFYRAVQRELSPSP